MLCRGKPVSRTRTRDSFRWNPIKKCGWRKAAIPWKRSEHRGLGGKIEEDFYSIKCGSICHNLSNLPGWLGEGSQAGGEVKCD